MNIRVRFEAVSAAETAQLREAYLDSLPHAQELMLEVLVPSSAHFQIKRGEELCGYFIVHDTHVLIEFHLLEEYVVHCHAILLALLDRTQVRTAWIKTFDELFLAYALDLQSSVRVMGCLARGYSPRPLPTIASIHFTRRAARLEDLERILKIDQDVFTNPERLRGLIERGFLHLYEKGDDWIGFGITRPIRAGHPDVELGIVVDAPFRNRGFAIYMLRDLADYAVSRGLTPVAGCALANAPSWRMGLRVGMHSVHRLLEVRFKEEELPQPGDQD